MEKQYTWNPRGHICEECGSIDIKKIDNDHYLCNDCHFVFAMQPGMEFDDDISDVMKFSINNAPEIAYIRGLVIAFVFVGTVSWLLLRLGGFN